MATETIKAEFEFSISDQQMNIIAQRAATILEKKQSNVDANKNYSVNQVAKITNLTTQTIRTHCRNNILIASKTGKNYNITQASLNQYLSKNE
jgi:hypothetical protein